MGSMFESGVKDKRGGKRQGSGRKLTDEKKEKIITLYKQDFSMNKISKEVKSDKRTIKKVLAGVPNLIKIKPPPKTKETNSKKRGNDNLAEYNLKRSIEKEVREMEIKKVAEQGYPPKHIIEEMNLDYTEYQIREVLKKFGYLKYKKRRKQRKKYVIEPI